jgi:hypothetical protein
MRTLFTAEAISNGGRSRNIQTPDQLLNVTLGNPVEKGGMNKMNGLVDRIKIGFGMALLTALTGCVGYVDGGYYGGSAVVPGPSVYFWGGDYDRGRDVHVYSQRGVQSRAVAHPPAGHAAPQRGGHEMERK